LHVPYGMDIDIGMKHGQVGLLKRSGAGGTESDFLGTDLYWKQTNSRILFKVDVDKRKQRS